jgi:hypothetical protein
LGIWGALVPQRKIRPGGLVVIKTPWEVLLRGKERQVRSEPMEINIFNMPVGKQHSATALQSGVNRELIRIWGETDSYLKPFRHRDRFILEELIA